MKPRITVPGIFALQPSRKIFSAGDKQTINCCYSNSELVLIGTYQDLMIYQLPDFQLLAQHRLASKPVTIVQLKNYFFVLCQKGVVECLEWVDSKLSPNCFLEGHLLPINSIAVINQGEVATCSDDFTVRIWQGEEPFSIGKILAGHKGKPQCLEAYREFLFSGSSEKEVIVWRDRKLFHRFEALEAVEAIMACLESSYLAVATKSSELEMYDLRGLRTKKLPLLYTVKLPLESGLSGSKQLVLLDDHFIAVVKHNRLSFIQIYMKEHIRTTSLPATIASVTPINSMVVFADQQHLYLQDLCL